MKKLLFIAVLLLCTVSVNSQNSFNVQNELVKTVKIPNTPEATAFAKYGDINANLYTGTPNISIPIYTFKGREINLPISLTYNASGIKVAQLASQAGLGWNLNVGGRISRTVNGLPDDNLFSSNSYQTINSTLNVYLKGINTNKTLPDLISDYLNPPSSFPSLQAAKDYFYFLKEVSDNKIDTQPDFFSFNALGYSNQFVYDMGTSSFKPLDNPNTKISLFYDAPNSIRNWTITTDDGTIFYFTQAEKTQAVTEDSSGSSLIVSEYNSSWLLTKIVSPNRKDTFDFSYTDLGLSATEPQIASSSATNTLGGTQAEVIGSGSVVEVQTNYTISQSILTQINYNGKPIVKINYKTRDDFNLNSAIDNIEIIKLEDNQSVVKKFKFNHSYFGVSASQNSFDKRLKLDNLQETSSSNTVLKTYSFDYFNPSNVPPRYSLSRDYLGLYNGASNSVLYPEKNLGAFTLSGANRNPNFNTAIYGTLQKVTYPTGGFTEYEYEAHRSIENQGTTSNVTHGTLSVVGGTGSSSSCGTCCQDQYDAIPIINTILFNIVEAGNYNILYERTGMDGEAYLLKRSGQQNYTTPYDYNQIIDQSNCNELAQINWSNFIGSHGDVVYLNPGTYQITIAKPPTLGNPSAYTKLQVWREESTGPIDVDRAGIRVKSIKSYEKTGVVSLEKQYKYTTTYTNSVSSGQMLFTPTFFKTTNIQVLENEVVVNKEILSRPTSWSSGNTPHIAYAKAFEIQKKGSLNNDGYIEHNFNTGIQNGITNNGGANYYSNEFKNGKSSATHTYNSDDNLLKQDSTKYTNPIFFGKSTIYIHNNPINTYNVVRIHNKNTPSGTYRVTYEPVLHTVINGSQVGTYNPPPCNDGYSFCFDTLIYSTLETRQTYAQGKIGNVSSTKSYDYFNSSDVVSQITNYSYYKDTTIVIPNNPLNTVLKGNHLLKATSTINSKGESLKKEYLYLDQVSDGRGSLSSNNILTIPLETKTYKNNVLMSHKKTHYSGTLPSKIQTAKGNNVLEDRILFERFENSNLVQVKQVGGSSTAYIWGYDNRYIVAKVENATYSDIENLTNFGVGFTISTKLSSAQESDLRAMSNSLVTTFEYNSAVGVTSITDPRGKTIYYYYDDFNRLEFVKDDDGNILSNNQYNYKN